MASGTDVFFGLFNNLAIFIVLVAIYGVLNKHFDQSSPLIRQSVTGLCFGIFAIVCMHVKIPVAEGVIVDQRNAVVMLSGGFGGPLSAIISAILAGIYRVHLGGQGIYGGLLGLSLAAGAGIFFYFYRAKLDNILKVSLYALAATIFILPGFLPFKNLQTGWELLKAMALPYGLAVFVGVLFVGLLLANEEHRYFTELEQKKSETRYRELFENLIDVSYRADTEGNIFLVSPSVEKVFGYRPEEVIGKKIGQFFKHPSQQEDFFTLIQRDAQIDNFEIEMTKKDGTPLWISSNAKLLLDNDGAVIGVEGIARDISKRKKAELENRVLEEKLRQSQKMEAMGTLAGGIAHDFNNILTAVIGYTELALNEAEEGSRLHQNLLQINAASMRAGDLVRQILSFSRHTEVGVQPLQMAPLVKEALRLIRSSVPATVDIKQDIDATTKNVMADPTQIHQIVMNLCTNAAQAMEENGGRMTVSLKQVHLSPTELHGYPDLPAGDYALLRVQDTGHGIDNKIINRIFDPYFTTKESGKGTGLGLSVVDSIVRSFNGGIYVRNDLGKGTVFEVFLPMVEEHDLAAQVEDVDLKAGTETILLVDDEPDLIDFERQLLQGLGYEVLAFTNSLEALNHFQQAPEKIDLVITDMTMPEMTGDILAIEMLQTRPQLPIILCTGFSSRLTNERVAEIGVKALITKPITARKLGNIIRQALDGEEPAA